MRYKYSIFLILTAIAVFFTSVNCRADRGKQIGIVVTGFGAPAISVIGVLEVLNEYHINIDYAAGTSLGAMIIGLYSCGYSPSEIERMFKNIRYEDYLKDYISRDTISIGERKYRDYHLLRINFSGTRIELPKGLISAQKLLSLLDKYTVGCTYDADMNFNRLPIPLSIVATSLDNGNAVILNSGMLSNAIRATISMPPYISPFQYRGKRLADGSLSEPIPAEILKQKGVKIVIAVLPQEKKPYMSSVSGIVDSIFYAYKTSAVKNELKHVNVVIRPATSPYNITDFEDIKTLIALGKIAAYKAIPDILDLLNVKPEITHRYSAAGQTITSIKLSINLSDSGDKINRIFENLVGLPFFPQGYTEDVKKAKRLLEIKGWSALSFSHNIANSGILNIFINIPVIYEIKITGNKKTSSGVIRRYINLRPGELFNLSKVIADQQRIYASGYFDNVYFTLKKHTGNMVTLEYHVIERPTTYIGIGLRDDMDEGLEELIDFNMDNFIGTGTRLYLHTISGRRMTYRIGYEVPELFNTHTGIDVSGFYKRSELFLYGNYRKASLYAKSQWGGKFSIEHHISTDGMLYIFYKYEYLKVNEILGSIVGSPPISNPQSIGIGFRYDTLDNIIFPLHGILINTELANVDNPMHPAYAFNKFIGSFDIYRTLSDIHTFGISVSLGRIDNGSAPFYERFALGGMSYLNGYYQLLGYNREEFIGRNLAVGAFSYRLKMPQPSSSLLKRWFFSVNLQAGDTFNYMSEFSAKAGIGLGLYFDTLFSPIRFDIGWAGDRHAAYYITAGYSF